MRKLRIGTDLTRTVALAALTLVVDLAPAQAVASCEPSDGSSKGLKRCLLIEQGLRATYEARLADADTIWRQLRVLDPSDPAPALYEASTSWWRNLLDEGVVAHDTAIAASAAEAERLAEARLEHEPNDPIALYQLGEALFHSARLNGIRGSYLRAGRGGERARVALERALELRPDLTEIKYPLGLYYYYASVGPSVFKYVSWLWFVPRGDRETGLRYLREVRDAGGRNSVDATFIMMIINNYHAPLDLTAALASGRSLRTRFPTNPLFHFELIEVLLKIGLYEQAITLALDLERSTPITPEAVGRPQMARILRAQAQLMSGRSEEAWSLVADMDPKTAMLPTWGGAWIHLLRGQVHDIRGERGAAITEYERVTSLEGGRHSRRATAIAKQCIESPFAPSSYEELPMVGAAPE